ncbi:MAG: efflux RND transporter periplasmic adaptor subunit [Mucilaginibacter sp.]|nr:efflux RND transporter periplasmic adaptor subunit [Mucilaginibacter sp.]
MKKQLIIKTHILVLLTGSLFSLVSCKSNNANSDERPPYVVPDSLMRKLVIDTAKISNITYAVKFNGIVDYNTDKVANIFPLVSGNVQDIRVMPGDYVHAGQILGMVKSPEIANYNSALVTAESNVRLNQKLLEQQRELFKSGLASQIDITNAEVNYEQALASKVAAEKILSINGNNKNGEFYIKSPVDGFIVQKNVTNGMSVRTDNGGNMFTISDLKNVWVQANVYESNIESVHEGDLVDVSTISYPDRIFKGKVDKLMNVLDPTSKVMKMRVILDNPGYILKPQMFATIALNNTVKNKAVAISSGDLIFDHSQYYVIVVTGKKDVQIRPVEVLSISGNKAYIKAGLSQGDRIIGSQALLIYGSLNS